MVKRTKLNNGESESVHDLINSAMQENLDKSKAKLAIDEDDLDSALIEQPEFFFHVCEHYARAVARRDETKLDLDEIRAMVDAEIREDATTEGRRITETQIDYQLRADERVRKVKRRYIADTAVSDAWGMLKESFQQRSFMLREMVSLAISQQRDIASAYGSSSRREARDRKAGQVRAEVAEKRTRRTRRRRQLQESE